VDLPTVNVLSLATGAGGLDLGVRMALGAARMVCAVEIEAYACAVLAARMEEGWLDPCPVWTDLRTFDGKPWRGVVDLVTGGYPCQPFSLAGKRLGADDPRHLWPHVARIVLEVGPRWCFFENVAGHLSLGADLVLRELGEMGYRVEAGLFTAAEVGAPHRRQRLFILGELADAAGIAEREPHDGEGADPRQVAREGTRGRGVRVGEDVADTDLGRLEGERRGGVLERKRPTLRGDAGGCGCWPPGHADRAGWAAFLERFPGAQPAVRRDADGLASGAHANRIDRLRLCGNGVVPQQAALALRHLMAKLHVLD
jgi:DNA (cytosine-5)-methyltransferase 1